MKNIGSYPAVRLRRNRKKDWSRRLVQDNNLSPNDLIWPIFIREGKNIKEPIKTMPGVYRYSLDKIENFLKDKKKIWIDDLVPREFYEFPYASKWIGFNIISINPDTVFVDNIQKNFIKTLEDNGFKVIQTPMRHSRTLGGGFHCVTLDLERSIS